MLAVPALALISTQAAVAQDSKRIAWGDVGAWHVSHLADESSCLAGRQYGDVVAMISNNGHDHNGAVFFRKQGWRLFEAGKTYNARLLFDDKREYLFAATAVSIGDNGTFGIEGRSDILAEVGKANSLKAFIGDKLYVSINLDGSQNALDATTKCRADIVRAKAEGGDTASMVLLGYFYELGEGVAGDMAEARRWYIAAAERGDAEAQVRSAAFMLANLGGERDLPAAEMWLRKAAAQAHPEAIDAVRQINEHSIQWLADGGALGEALAAAGRALAQGLSTDRAGDEPQPQVAEAEERMRRAEHAYSEGNYTLALQIYGSEAEAGNAEAAFQMGEMYREGRGVSPNPRTAFLYYLKSAVRGHFEGQVKVGLGYQTAEGTSRNMLEALRWFRRAAQSSTGDNAKRANDLIESAIRWTRYYEPTRADEIFRQAGLDVPEELPKVAAAPVETPSLEGAARAVETGDYAKARSFYRDLASQGNSEAAFQLGSLYQYGRGVQASAATALSWFMKAASEGHFMSQIRVGVAYQTGNGTQMDLPTALVWFRKATETGTGFQVQMAKGLLNDAVREVRRTMPTRAAAIFRDAGVEVAEPRPPTMADATAALEVRNYAEARRIFSTLARAGDRDAAYALGNMYRDGRGSTRDPREAFRWYLSAANGGHFMSQVKVGVSYQTGDGTDQDLPLALNWFRKATQSGTGFQVQMAQALLDDVVRKIRQTETPTRAAAILREAGVELDASLKVAEAPKAAMEEATRAFQRGNYDEARKLYAALANAGEYTAAFALGNMYRDARGVKQDLSEALRWYLKAARAGHYDAQIRVGFAYQDAEGVSRDMAEALRWFRRAAVTSTGANAEQAQFRLTVAIRYTRYYEPERADEILRAVGIAPTVASVKVEEAPALVTVPAAEPDNQLVVPNTGKRFALIVANEDYSDDDYDLANPSTDAEIVRKALEAAGFTVRLAINADKQEFEVAVADLADEARDAEVALFYFTGHGYSLEDRATDGPSGPFQTYLTSTSYDFDAKQNMQNAQSMSLDDIRSQLTTSAHNTLIFVDACQTLDTNSARGGDGERAKIVAIDTSFRSYASLYIGSSTRFDRKAADGIPGRGSVFAQEFAKNVVLPGVAIGEVFRKVRLAVRQQSSGSQVPAGYDELNEPIILVPGS